MNCFDNDKCEAKCNDHLGRYYLLENSAKTRPESSTELIISLVR